jgi:hypothetical protein
MIEVRCIVETYDTKHTLPITVHSHWNESRKIVLEVNGLKYEIMADELIQAIQNCTKTAKY